MNQTSKEKSEKILLVTRPLSPPWDEASKNFAYDLACNLMDHDVTILVDQAIPDAPEHITQKQIYTSNQFSLTQKIHLVRYLFKNVENFNIIHLLFTPTKFNSWLMQKVLKDRNVKIVQTIATVRDDLYSNIELKKMFFGDVLVTYSQWAQQKLQNLGHANVTQIYPGINLSKYIPSEKDQSLMKKWHIKPTDKVVTYPGEFTRLGATDLIAQAFLDLWKNSANSHIKYLCACRVKNDLDKTKKEEVIKKIANAGHSDKVIFTETFSDMNAIYNLSDIIIFPAKNMHGKFDVPLAMIEPYACKKPVIASDLPLFKEFSGSHINAIIPTANADALRDGILSLLSNTNKQKELGENAYTFAHQTFNIEKIAQSYGKIYKNL